ncbi:MAG TPA: hypothetical protein PLQ56_00880 [Aggregatilineales bacterium]|nr:hypothetical protein [Anaerolineae bacterium]HUN05115.1 hypothetical protein [Aggregatilineales bacterium]
MPIQDYHFQDRIFFAREVDVITPEDAREWATRLKEAAAQSPVPIVALVDALGVSRVSVGAHDIFSKASYTRNVKRVVVATNVVVSGSASNISLLGKRNQTEVFRTLEEARQHAESLVVQPGTGELNTT